MQQDTKWPFQNRPLMSSACLLSLEKLKFNQISEKMQKQREALKQDKIIRVSS